MVYISRDKKFKMEGKQMKVEKVARGNKKKREKAEA